MLINPFIFKKAETYLLDDYPGASLAYSLRELSSAWAGQPVVTVREKGGLTDDTFTAEQITNGDLVAFCAGNDGQVIGWHDQSGNGRDATNVDLDTAPNIVTAGVLETDEFGRPVINPRSDSLRAIYDVGVVGNLNKSVSIFSVTTANPDGGSGALFGTGGTSLLVFGRWGGSGDRGILMNGSGSSSFPSTTALTALSAFALSNGNNLGYENGVETLNVNASNTYTLNGCSLWVRGTATSDYETAEFVLYESDQTANRAGIEANQNAHYNIF